MWNWFVVFFFLLILIAVLLSIFSRYRKNETGLFSGRLRNCPDRPNCVSSEDRDKTSFVEPVVFPATPDTTWSKAEQVLQAMGGTIVDRTENYLHATFTSSIFRFVDDMELRLDARRKTIHIRSSSRVGYSDMGVNRKRAEEFRHRLIQRL